MEEHSKRIIVGLGNPGEEYSGTRHNVGFALLRKLAQRYKVPGPSRKARALVSSVRLPSCRLILAQPLTYMNRSGRAVSRLLSQYELTPSALLVVHDDLDLDPGRIRFRPAGGDGGHRGVASIISELGDDTFARLKIGIGRPGPDRSPADYVLEPFDVSQQELMDRVLERACDGVECFLKDGIETAMNEYNGLP